jgi:hypothetical protein
MSIIGETNMWHMVMTFVVVSCHQYLTCTAKDCSMYINPVYIQCCKDFQQRTKGSKRKTPLRVLDLFCGIGSGTVVLYSVILLFPYMLHEEYGTFENEHYGSLVYGSLV